jgi:hypothetical protein
MAKRWTDLVAARQVADALTDLWLAAPKKAHLKLQRAMVGLLAQAEDCPECEVCCAVMLCCPLGSEAQRAALTRLLMAA